jgi:hypothetical protein
MAPYQTEITMAFIPQNPSFRAYANAAASQAVNAAVSIVAAGNTDVPAPKPAPTLGSLPVEMLLAISRHLDVASLNQLASTNSFNHCALTGSTEQLQAEDRYVNDLDAKLRSARNVSQTRPLVDRAIAYLSRTGSAMTPNDDRLFATLLGLPVMSGGGIGGPLHEVKALTNSLGKLGHCLHARQGLPWPDSHRKLHAGWRELARIVMSRTGPSLRDAALADLKENMPPGSHDEKTYDNGLLATLARPPRTESIAADMMSVLRERAVNAALGASRQSSR